MHTEKIISLRHSPRIESIKDHILFQSKLPEVDKIELKYQLDQLVEESRREVLALPRKLGNPAVVGLAAFGVSSMLLQFHNLGWMNMTPIIYVGMIFGGLAQMIAGLMEFGTGNNFGFCAFTTYGAFWVAFCLLQLDHTHNLTEQDKALFLLAFAIYTAIMFIASFRENVALMLVFFLLLLGLILLVFFHFFPENIAILRAAGAILLIDAFGALYVMTHLIYKDKFQYDVLPVGPPCQYWFRKDRNLAGTNDVEKR